ncbi:MAG: hypothetical protein IH577_01260, partial [Deltaproteobacteria bacterium]|nr:hypothetical protein [Deltaproteobacteria bacterium]
MKRAGAVLAFLTVCVVLLIAGTIYYYRDSASSGLKPTSGPGFTWGVAAPGSQGLDTAKLDSMWATLQSKSTSAFLVIRNDRIVYEKYVSMNRNQKHYTASMVKGLAGGMSLMVAMNDGLISSDHLVRQYVPQ